MGRFTHGPFNPRVNIVGLPVGNSGLPKLPTGSFGYYPYGYPRVLPNPILWLLADARPALVKAIVALEPLGPPFSKVTIRTAPGSPYGISNAPLTYDPPVNDPAVDLVRCQVKAGVTGLLDGLLQASKSELPPRKLVNLRDVLVLVVTGQASYHAPYDWCTVEYLRQAGVDADHLKLEDVGILGNGHMMFLEKNSDRVAQEVQMWLERILTH
ncbi:uncharacterized protein CTRU02_206455 [Colletotrichum truncatum]|uniref:Uncharacterized protein n=1 Tax=Colletotrichum truncatum TaxID=5467 RepID=A0ACC3Z712_COLTU|nr:uncharacterized protein CTRU02_15222 [Colletotrichum truncatum]KAF6781269.1 hypothetical protein CTRU02_15222 [Colletotrichum truncatum]